MRLILILFFCLVINLAYSQKKQEDKLSNSYQPFVPELSKAKQKELKRKTTKKKAASGPKAFNKNLNKKQDEFWDRLEANAKRDRKIARKMQHPKYSDPMYFGHKKKPKKRPPGKRKFCKECGIVH